MSASNKVFGQAGENPRNLPDSLLKRLTIKNRGNSPWETLKSFGSKQLKKEANVSIIVKLGPEGRLLGSKWIAQGSIEDVSLDISDLTGVTGEKDQKVVAKLNMSDLTKFEFGTIA